ncbi:MAG TPA: thioredoxin family protein [Chitinophagaceae bacterium]|nr:thioredoxin family protein [Chitinophagaceae bacterium]
MKTRLTLFAFVLISATSLTAQQAPASAEEIMKEAFMTAQRQDKKVLIIFHASWCSWCHKMDTSLNDVSVKKFFDDNFVIRHLVVFESKGKVDLENPGALELITKYNGKDQGIPFWLIFDKNEKFLADSRMTAAVNGVEKFQNSGCPATKEEVDYFIEVLKRTTLLNGEQLEKIRTRFRKNETN